MKAIPPPHNGAHTPWEHANRFGKCRKGNCLAFKHNKASVIMHHLLFLGDSSQSLSLHLHSFSLITCVVYSPVKKRKSHLFWQEREGAVYKRETTPTCAIASPTTLSPTASEEPQYKEQGRWLREQFSRQAGNPLLLQRRRLQSANILQIRLSDPR